MTGKYPQDRVNDRTDVPETYERDHERLATSDAAVRDAADPVSGARPDTEPVPPEADELADEDSKPRS